MPKLASYKRIILCADGTWLASDQGDKSVPSNVAKIARAIATSGPDADGKIVKQIVSYHSGLGAGALPFQKTISGAIGRGLDIEVCKIYDFISNNYEPGDELFFLGFSRGAFTVRSVAGLIGDIGVLRAVHMSHFAEMWKAYCENTDGQPFIKTPWYQQNKDKLRLTDDIRIKVVGVWDTVGALGIPEWPFLGFATKLGIAMNKQYAFHNTKLSKNLDYAFQALAIDERRKTYLPTLWHKTSDAPAKELQQCWFPGVHRNIGGQAEDPPTAGDHEEIGNITFAWMVDNLSGMLTFEEAAIDVLLEQHQHAQAANNAKNNITDGWGCGTIVSNFSGLRGAFFRILGKQDRTPGNYPQGPDDGNDRATDEYFHPIVRIRKSKLSNYNPTSLYGYSAEKSDSDAGWMWHREDRQTVPEYVMRPEKKMSLVNEGGYKTTSSLSRLMCPKLLLADIDRDNGVTPE
ncbi:protein of unknown function DUF2235 [Penicillium expansum]|uniref:T6SS Phospholipase effector Tle1-like catalytic domain-containing protein n=1 Tax=Penicillium expansum TaxID=27334 RepID=A0A0A2J5B2_PENEN|nr:protein of unknown function DUF2235 [Penicillium expansum]KGO37688.1 protein of unknown function DUF2235 [Penicillium expansum]KGO49961.1 protein of unknown function DUF2235 [Penicillium expansum]KGO54178.1 protein of unknown function DUF2235 [Penicillium expansum]